MNILYSSSMYSGHLFLISSASFRSIPFLSFIVPVFAWNVPFVSLIFLKRTLVYSILLFSSISLHWSWRKAFLSLLVIRWNSAFKWVYLSLSPLSLTSLFTAICKDSSGKHFAFSYFFSLGWRLILPHCDQKRCLKWFQFFFNLPRLELWPSMWSILENALCALEKKV